MTGLNMQQAKYAASHIFSLLWYSPCLSWGESGDIVGNCHQIPADRFIPVRLSVEEIVEEWSAVIASVKKETPMSGFCSL